MKSTESCFLGIPFCGKRLLERMHKLTEKRRVRLERNMKTKKFVSIILVTIMLLSMSCAFAFASDVNNKNQPAMLPGIDVVLGNVPAVYAPNSEIVFDSKGASVATNVSQFVPVSDNGTLGAEIEVGGNLADHDPIGFKTRDAETRRTLENLPVYIYEDYYIAGEGAVAQYDQDGQLIRVRGDYKYFSTLDQYMVNGVLPNGTYRGTFGQFSVNVTRAGKTVSGKITTYGDYWPAISQTAYPNCNTDPVPSPPNGPSNYGDRIGTQNNKLYIGDVATRPSDNIPYGAWLTVTIVPADTGHTSNIVKSMRKRDIMGATTPILDIWRWDQPNWWTGKAAAPNDLYFNKKYNTNLSFPSLKNYYTY